MEKVIHNIPPVFNQDSKILLLGTMPSPKSRETGFFYGHPGNRMWQVLSTILQTTLPTTNTEKTELLLTHRIAMWDVLQSCTIVGASDSSIRDAVPNDLSPLLKSTQISRIYCTGKTAHKLYTTHLLPATQMEACCLPSTSGANARMGVAELVHCYSDLLHDLK